MDKKHKALLKSNAHTLSLLDQLKNKYAMQRDLNQMYRRFYARNVADQIKKEDFDHNVDTMFKDFNVAMGSKDNFIAENMHGLEQLVDQSSIIKSDSMRQLLFGDLDEEVALIKKEREAKQQAK